MDLGWRGEAKKAAKELFGRPLRLALAAWIVDRSGEPFYMLEAQDAMRAFDEAASGVATELRLMNEFGMLSVFQDGRRIYYAQTASPYWPPFEAVAVALGLLKTDQS